jgi:glutathione S-transferase
MWQWMFWEQYSHEPYIAVRRFQLLYLRRFAEQLDPKLLERGRDALRIMEHELERSSFMVADRLTLADVALVAYTRLAPEGGFNLSDYPAVCAWIRRVEVELDIVGP